MWSTKHAVSFVMDVVLLVAVAVSAEWTENDSDLKTLRTDSLWFYDLTFSSATTGWATAIDESGYDGGDLITVGQIYKTVNGGKNWELQPMICTCINGYKVPHSISFVDENHGWILHEDTLHHTVDGGATWTRVEAFTGTFSDIYFLTEKKGIACYNKQLFFTEDAGATWEITVSEEDGYFTGLMDIHFADTLTGWIVGGGYTMDGGAILKTTDGGRSWELIHGLEYRAIWGIDSQHVVAAGGEIWVGEVIYTSFDGITTGIHTNVDPVLTDVAFIDSGNGVVTGRQVGHVFQTADGGRTWEACEISSQDYFVATSVYGNTMYVISLTGKIFKYEIPAYAFAKPFGIAGQKVCSTEPLTSVFLGGKRLSLYEGFSLLGRRLSSGARGMTSGVIVKKVPELRK